MEQTNSNATTASSNSNSSGEESVSTARIGSLSGRVALVTGAGRGIGAATASLLADAGARVVVNDLDEDAAQNTVEAIRLAGGEAQAFACDMTSQGAADALVEFALEAYASLDIVVNNAGYVWNSALHNHSDEQWQAMLDVHATAPFRLLRAYYPWLKARVADEREQGVSICRKIVNISSVSGTDGAPTQVGYAAAKAAVVGLTKTLAKEWGRLNVTVNCVAFGPIETRLTQAFDATPPTIDVAGKAYKVGLANDQIEDMLPRIPLGRVGQSEDAAGAIYLFCIPQSDFVTGQLLVCSGGLRS